MAEGKQDFVLPTSAVPTGLLCFVFPTQDFILGYFQSSLRDWAPDRSANILVAINDALF